MEMRTIVAMVTRSVTMTIDQLLWKLLLKGIDEVVMEIDGVAMEMG
jgi:hypothetical protein